jgi:hypothetical protein
MANRDYGRGGRGGPYDRDYDRRDSSERERDERLERGEHAGGRYYGRGRGYDRDDREFRGGPREPDWNRDDEWQFGRSPRGSREHWGESERDRWRDRGEGFSSGSHGGSYGSRDYESWNQGAGRERRDQYDRGRYERGYTRGDPRDEMSDREYGGIGSSSLGGGFGGYGPMGGGYAGSTPIGGGYGGYGGYGSGGFSGSGPSAGFGYSGAGSYIGREYYGGGIDSRRQNFTGRGPKGYRRSDERIREEINEALWRHPEVDASDVEIRVDGADVILTGVVEDRRIKRLVEDVTENVWGVNDVRNELKVRHGFIAALTGERVDEREVERLTAKETGSSSSLSQRTTAGPARSSSTPGT